MKAIFGLVGLLFVSAVAQAYVWVTPVYKCPYPQAPSTWNGGFYLLDSEGRWTGPHYYLVPPNRPFQGVLPGQTGCAIQSGNLPHTLLMGKDGMNIGNVPMLQQSRGKNIFNFGDPNPGSMPPAGNPGFPYWASGRPPVPMQVPYGAPPTYNASFTPYPMMPGPMYYPGQVPARPVAWQNPGANAWPAQNVHGAPFGTIPNFNPQGPMPPMMPPTAPMPPYPQMNPFTPMQPPMAPQPGMEFPRPDSHSVPTVGGAAFPMHPFTRSPRDFFMWSENMEDEQRLRNRPFPVPR